VLNLLPARNSIRGSEPQSESALLAARIEGAGQGGTKMELERQNNMVEEESSAVKREVEMEDDQELMCVAASRRSPRLDRNQQQKKAKSGVRFKSCSLDGWPQDINYTHTPDFSGVSPADKRQLRQDYLPGVSIRRVADTAHPACGQNALYATTNFTVGDVLGEYTGKVMPGHHGGEYVTRLWNTGANADYYRPGVDAQDMGNELRMINDYRGVPGAAGPNCKFSRTALRGMRAALIVVIAPVAIDEELLLDYGEVYWRQGLVTAADAPGTADAGEARVRDEAVSTILPSDLEALENDLREMVSQAFEGDE
jgi:hypothetical protein